MALIQSKKNWQIIDQEKNVKKGKLVRVEISPGRFVKMYEADVYPEKMKKPQGNKMAKIPPQNKQAETSQDIPDPVAKDDLTAISGVGKATERALNDNEIFTFSELAAVGNLPFLTESVNEKIQAWRDGWGDSMSE